MIVIAKIKNDKYYTGDELVKYCIEKTKEIIGEENISEWLEPAAGGGVFLNHLPKGTLAYDIEPEDNRVIKQDFLEVDLEYKKGRCTIGNPPFGDNKCCLFEKFYKKAIHFGDYIAFILPISQYKNDLKLYEFDLIYSEDLEIKEYSNVELHCCFNIYRRPKSDMNIKPNYNLKDVIIKRHDRKSREIYNNDFDYNIRICSRGSSVGKECKYENQYAKEYCIKILNKNLRDRIIDLIKNTDWRLLIPNVSTPFLPQYQIYKYIKEQIPEIE